MGVRKGHLGHAAEPQGGTESMDCNWVSWLQLATVSSRSFRAKCSLLRVDTAARALPELTHEHQ
jgi:hypothetical protein